MRKETSNFTVSKKSKNFENRIRHSFLLSEIRNTNYNLIFNLYKNYNSNETLYKFIQERTSDLTVVLKV